MEANIDTNRQEEKVDFWHSGWAYLVFIGLLIGGFVGLYYVLKIFGLY
jgi:hypothetical protein